MKKAIFAILIIGVAVGFFLRELLSEKPAGAKIVTISSRNLNYQITTTAKTIGEVLKEQGFNDSTIMDSSFRFRESTANGSVAGMTIEVKTPLQIKLNDGGNESQITTTALTVNDLLYEQKIGLAVTDRVVPDLASYLGEGTRIVIDRIVDLEVSEESEIGFETRVEHDPSIFYGTELVTATGKPGKKRQDFLITYKNGVEIKRKLLKTTVLEKPQPENRKFGTRIEIEETREGRGSWYAYKNCLCAAHPFYEFGRFVRVTGLATGKSIIVRINDRGPELDKHPDRIIDLDSVAYKALAPLGSGTIAVKVELFR